MWVKICANTSLEDALIAVDAGADAVGFVFAPSKRQVVAAQVAAITPRLPKRVEKVGVFSTDDVDDIVRTVSEAGLDTVQLHGGVRLELARALSARLTEVGIIPTLSWEVNGTEDQRKEAEQQIDQVAAAEDYRLLVDSRVGTATGGTGVSFNWTQACAVLKRHINLRLIVAGGLNSENVGMAIQALKPWGVDVASGVEKAPGIKDRAKVEAFIRNARAAAR